MGGQYAGEDQESGGRILRNFLRPFFAAQFNACQAGEGYLRLHACDGEGFLQRKKTREVKVLMWKRCEEKHQAAAISILAVAMVPSDLGSPFPSIYLSLSNPSRKQTNPKTVAALPPSSRSCRPTMAVSGSRKRSRPARAPRIRWRLLFYSLLSQAAVQYFGHT